MPFKPKIFISHSLHDTNQKPYLDLVRAVLEEVGFETFTDEMSIDQRLEFAPQIRKELLTCDGAIILLNKKALERSHWVPCEAFVFRARKDLDKSFPILPLALEKLDLTCLGQDSLSPCRLDDFIVWPKLDKATLMQKIETYFGDLKNLDGAPQGAVYAICELLSRVPDAFCRNLAQDLKLEGTNPHKTLAEGLLATDGLTHFNELLQEIGKITANEDNAFRDLLLILNLITPSWVNLKAAAQLYHHLKEQRAPTVFWLYGHVAPFIGPCMLRRATCETTSASRFLPKNREKLHDGNALVSYFYFHFAQESHEWDEAEKYIEDLRKEIARTLTCRILRQRLARRKKAYLSGQFDRDIQNTLAESKKPFVLIVGKGMPESYVDTVVQTFPQIPILALWDQSAQSRVIQGARNIRINPVHSLDKEKVQFGSYIEALRSI